MSRTLMEPGFPRGCARLAVETERGVLLLAMTTCVIYIRRLEGSPQLSWIISLCGGALCVAAAPACSCLCLHR